ncbi:hypothetical protein BZA05DRAFT_385138 [Tricharina praecox]|uniref:uncharacterized protein n=1 Tax=Tricharina praecox TaxID=43433 RepID=UPI00221FF2F0|nr:uncharacterized protein BZA05DRAFT_385138 [Tricharina praecox]KAI5857877.1 hypothetical protein BZA05DRAFT_385138 [Tricharina praecox]
MVFILGINIPENRVLKTALQNFYGVGPSVASKLCAKLSIHKTAQVGTLGTSKTMVLADELSKMTIENDLRRQLKDDIKRLRDMGTYRGRRHAQGLPVRGQRTRTQINTARRLNRVERRG